VILDWQGWRVVLMDLLADLNERPHSHMEASHMEAYNRLALAAKLARTDYVVMDEDALSSSFFIHACGLICSPRHSAGIETARLLRRLGAVHSGARSYGIRVH
jgi:hypothetical protein